MGAGFQLKRRNRIWWIRYYRDGKRYEESSGSEKENDARKLLRLREGDIERGVAATPNVSRIRFEEAAEDVINDYRTNGKRSLDDLDRRIKKHLAPFSAAGAWHRSQPPTSVRTSPRAKSRG